jgi:hypothetical protein
MFRNKRHRVLLAAAAAGVTITTLGFAAASPAGAAAGGMHFTPSALDATSNGSLPPSGSLIAQPGFLWNDGSGFGGQGNDAFGIWRFPF